MKKLFALLLTLIMLCTPFITMADESYNYIKEAHYENNCLFGEVEGKDVYIRATFFLPVEDCIIISIPVIDGQFKCYISIFSEHLALQLVDREDCLIPGKYQIFDTTVVNI